MAATIAGAQRATPALSIAGDGAIAPTSSSVATSPEAAKAMKATMKRVKAMANLQASISHYSLKCLRKRENFDSLEDYVEVEFVCLEERKGKCRGIYKVGELWSLMRIYGCASYYVLV
ncbi:hypothetical protein LOK49_LG09G02231 [Camellia lanceoleosa]|uniref:Uncharacterized protein n=1 Tax=Camellia lanceoleosa TaxID=1840588 RepID=A0ACC0GQF5_9ERIC|nr:hypothetical protein LOK49_LG09G02231 [Camellia lanceoleosa]